MPNSKDDPQPRDGVMYVKQPGARLHEPMRRQKTLEAQAHEAAAHDHERQAENWREASLADGLDAKEATSRLMRAHAADEISLWHAATAKAIRAVWLGE